MRRLVLAACLALSARLTASGADAYFTPHFSGGDRFVDLYAKSVAVTGAGFEPVVRRFSGTSAYVVTSADPRAPRFDETDTIDGRAPILGSLEIRDAGNTNCYNGSCVLNTQTSGLMFVPLLWGTPPSPLHAGQRWTVAIGRPWEIGPAGTETVTVVSLDSANHIVVLRREGRGTGPLDDDARGIPIVVDGRAGHADLAAGPSRWTGQIVVRAGIVLSDEILIERRVTLTSDLGMFSGDERVYTLLTAAPSIK